MELLVLLSILLAHMIPEPRGRSGAGEHNESHQLVPWWYFSSELIDTSQGETRESKTSPHPARAARTGESVTVGRA
jgi:hypothetical protein